MCNIIMSFYKFKKPFLFGVLMLFVLFVIPQKSSAQIPVTDAANLVVNTTTATTNATIAGLLGSQFGKEFVGDSVANFIAKMILQKLTAQTVNWINSGFKGNPAFVTDPSQFFLDVGDNVASHFISSTALNRLCSPFKAQVRLALVKNYIKDKNNYSCSLSKIKDNYEAFTQDFSQGGWDGWFEMTQTSGGNPYSAYFAAENKLLIEIGTQKDKYKKQLDWGNGILSFERCKSGAARFETFEMLDNVGTTGASTGTDCLPQDKETVTPGTVINDQLTKALGSPWASLEAADEINEIVSALMQQLISKVVGGISSGLRGLSSSNTSSPGTRTFLQQMLDSTEAGSQETQDFYTNMYAIVPSDFGGTAPSSTSSISSFIIGGGGGSGPGCSALLMSGATSKQSIVKYAMEQVLIDDPAWNDSTDVRGFKEAVVDWLNSHGEESTQGWNGNCNNSANNLSIRTGPTTGEMYEIARDGAGCNNEPNPTMAESTPCRPLSGYTGPWSYLSTGQTPPGFVRGSGGGGTVTVTPTPTPVITGISPSVNIVAGQTTLTITGTNLTGTVRFTDSNGAPYTVSGTVNATKTQTTVKVPSNLPGGSATVRIFLNTNSLSNAWSITVDGAPASVSTAVDATPGWRGGLAHNTNNDTWLVVSESRPGDGTDGIYGRIINNDGTYFGPTFKIDSSVSALAPKVAYSSELQKYLVLWYDAPSNFGGTIYARFISQTGALEDLVSVAQDPSSSTLFYPNSILSYDSINNQFVFVWEGSQEGSTNTVNNIYLRALDNNKVFGNIVRVTNGGTRYWMPAVAVKSDGSEYCVVYDTRDQGGVKVKRVDAILGTTGAETSVTSAGATDVSIAYNSANNKYLVTWTESGSTKGKFLNSCDGGDGGEISTIKTGLAKAITSYNRTSNSYGIIGQNMTNIGNGYVIFNSQGVILRSGDLFGTGATNGNFSPVIAPNELDGRFGASSSKDHSTTRFASDI